MCSKYRVSQKDIDYFLQHNYILIWYIEIKIIYGHTEITSKQLRNKKCRTNEPAYSTIVALSTKNNKDRFWISLLFAEP